MCQEDQELAEAQRLIERRAKKSYSFGQRQLTTIDRSLAAVAHAAPSRAPSADPIPPAVASDPPFRRLPASITIMGGTSPTANIL